MQYLSGRFEEALALANRLHVKQARPGTDVPHVSHLMAVSSIVLEFGGNQDEAIAALFHDAAEDEGGKSQIAMTRELFGAGVADILSDIHDGFTRNVRPGSSWQDRRQAYLDSLPRHRPSALLVSAADKLHNASILLRGYRREGEAVWSRYEGGRDGTLWYYRALFGVFEQTGPKAVAGEFRLVIEQIEHIARRNGWRSEAADRRSPGTVGGGYPGRNLGFAMPR